MTFKRPDKWFWEMFELTFGKFSMARKPIINGGAIRPICLLLHFRPFSQKMVGSFFSILAWTIPRMVLINYSKVIFQGWKGLNLPLFSNFDTYCPFIQNLFSNLFNILAWSFPRMDGDNELWREGFDLITLRVIAMVRKVRFGSFSHISLY